jgi:ComEC/Rec2-related protein
MIDAAGSDAYTDEKAVLKALVFGDRSGIDNALRERFNRAGVGHLLAISGLHVGIVATLDFRWIALDVLFFPPLLWRGWGRQWAAAATLVPVLAYGVLAGMSASTQRAEIMVAVFLVALILGRSHDIINTLAVAALVILILFPPALFSISFQLSFAAVLTIVYGLEKIDFGGDRADRFIHRARNRLVGFVLSSPPWPSPALPPWSCFISTRPRWWVLQPICFLFLWLVLWPCPWGWCPPWSLFFRTRRHPGAPAGHPGPPPGVHGAGFFFGAFLCRRQHRYAVPAGNRPLLPDRLVSAEPA